VRSGNDVQPTVPSAAMMSRWTVVNACPPATLRVQGALVPKACSIPGTAAVCTTLVCSAVRSAPIALAARRAANAASSPADRRASEPARFHPNNVPPTAATRKTTTIPTM
jgi:hypothetical protein